MAKSQHENKTRALNLILSLLKSFPSMTDQELLEHVNRVIYPHKPIKIGTIEAYKEDLVKAHRAHWGIIPTGGVPPGFSRFHVYIETTFQRVTGEPQEAALRYQEWVAEEVQRRLREKYPHALISRGVDILLGADWDMVLTVDAIDYEQMHPFVTREVRTCRHVLRTRTAWVQTVVEPSAKERTEYSGDDAAETLEELYDKEQPPNQSPGEQET